MAPATPLPTTTALNGAGVMAARLRRARAVAGCSNRPAPGMRSLGARADGGPDQPFDIRVRGEWRGLGPVIVPGAEIPELHQTPGVRTQDLVAPDSRAHRLLHRRRS